MVTQKHGMLHGSRRFKGRNWQRKRRGNRGKKDAQVVAEEKLEEVNLGSNSQEPRLISISSRLSEKEILELILLLKEFKDVFA